MSLDEMIQILQQMQHLRKLPSDGKGLYLGAMSFKCLRSNDLLEKLLELRDWHSTAERTT